MIERCSYIETSLLTSKHVSIKNCWWKYY
uniref:Uncharacterized protein n=1 Tax=Lepeophtheirus salmonis TaxID=72036 RepID=A0A0K2UN56_LEPSM